MTSIFQPRYVLLLLLPLAACQSMEDKGYVKNKYGDWIKPGQRYFGDDVTYSREILVQTIPRGAYIERDNEYIGVAPIGVTVETDSDGNLRDWHTIRATDTPTGAWSEKRVSRGQPAPEKMLIDIRPYLSPHHGMRMGP